MRLHALRNFVKLEIRKKKELFLFPKRD